MPLYPVAAAAALLPLITVHLCYLLAASLGHVDWCIPHIHSCTSISSTGRQAPEFFLFKALMLPTAVIIAAYWWLTSRWLQQLGCSRQRIRRLLVGLGLLGSAALILYTVMLGAIGPEYQLLRRVGVSSFFGLTFIGQMLMLLVLREVLPTQARLRSIHRTLSYSAVFILLAGLASVLIAGISDELYHRVDDAFEWSVAVLLCGHVLLTAQAWRLSEFRMQLRVA